MAADLFRATGIGVSELTGTRFVPWTSVDLAGSNTATKITLGNATSGVTLTSAGTWLINAGITLNPIPDDTSNLSLDLRSNGQSISTSGFGNLDKLITYHSRDEYDVINTITLRGTTIVSAAAGQTVDLYLTGEISNSATNQFITVLKVN